MSVSGKLASLVFVATFAVGGCSTVMEANRPDPVSLQKFTVGERRFDVLAQLGPPLVALQKDGDNSCDMYKLYTHGTSGVGKGAIIAGEALADVYTLGLAEIALSPTEAATRNKLHPVIFCYSQDNILVSVKELKS